MRSGGGWTREDASALVEFAIAVPLLLLVVWCMVDFSRAYYTSNSLATAVREGARFAAVQQDPTAAAAQIDSVVRRAFTPLGGDTLTNSKINLTDSSATGGYVAVTVSNYNWVKVTPLTLFTGGVIQMTRRARFRWEREATT